MGMKLTFERKRGGIKMRKKPNLTEEDKERITKLRKQREDINKLVMLYNKLTGKNLTKIKDFEKELKKLVR